MWKSHWQGDKMLTNCYVNLGYPKFNIRNKFRADVSIQCQGQHSWKDSPHQQSKHEARFHAKNSMWECLIQFCKESERSWVSQPVAFEIRPWQMHTWVTWWPPFDQWTESAKLHQTKRQPCPHRRLFQCHKDSMKRSEITACCPRPWDQQHNTLGQSCCCLGARLLPSMPVAAEEAGKAQQPQSSGWKKGMWTGMGTGTGMWSATKKRMDAWQSIATANQNLHARPNICEECWRFMLWPARDCIAT